MKKKSVVIITALFVIVLLAYFVLPGVLVNRAVKSERKAAGLQQKSVRVGDHEIAYLEGGGNGEPIIMIHGFGANKDNWTRFARFISPSYHVVALDLPGFGQSTCLENGSYDIENQAKKLNGFVNAVGLKKFHLVGNSMGGYIAARYATMFPERVLTLGLFASAGVNSPAPSELMKRLNNGEPNPLIAGSVAEYDRLIRFVFYTPPEIPKFAKRILVAEAQSHEQSNQRIFSQIAAQMGDLEPDLPNIKARTLVLWGDHDRVLDVSCVGVLKKALPNCTAIIMKNCGHAPMIERPQETAMHYMAFLKNT